MKRVILALVLGLFICIGTLLQIRFGWIEKLIAFVAVLFAKWQGKK